MKRGFVAVALVALPLTSVAAQQTISFDDYTVAPFLPILDGYAGLNWTNFLAVNVLDFPIYGLAASYPYVGVNVVNQTASISARTTPFTLNSGIFRFRTDQVSPVSAIGYVGGTPTFSTLIGFPGVWEFNWENLSQVSFVALNTGAQFTVDNLTITEQTSTVPEPGSVALFATGLLGLAPILRRKLRK